ncbi:MAG: carboxypeptidase regulatory-like domain-containing protein [Vicinamibacteria bacterium]|nr:carboxypeptidase regulatory-like domain-containing protein [Vicinamibacteria bacterium]
MRTRWIAAIALSCLAPMAGAAIDGRVIDARGEPVAGAVVSARPLVGPDEAAVQLFHGTPSSALSTARSGPDGRFRLDGPATLASVEADAAGFAPAAEVSRGEGPITLVLRPAVEKRGSVVHAGRPVAGARLVWSSGGRPALVRAVETDAAGAFAVPDPDVWAWSLSVHHPDFDVLEAGRGWPAALRFELKAGQPLAGRVVTGSARAGVPGAVVRLDGTVRAIADGEGRFRIAHAPRSWRRVSARAAGFAGVARRTAGEVVIEAAPAREIAGVVREAGRGRPLAGVMVLVHSDEGEEAGTFSDASGAWVVRGLPSARYRVWLHATGYQEAAGGSEPQDLRRATTARRDADLEAVPRIAGTVVDAKGQPLAGASVVWVPEGMPAFYASDFDLVGARSALSDGDGRFELHVDTRRGRLPGAGALMAVRRGFAARVAPLPEAGGTARIVLEVGVPLAGRVVDESGAPLAGVAVAAAEDGVLPQAGMPSHLLLAAFRGPGHVETDADGRFALGVGNRPHHLAFHKPGFRPLVLRDQVPAEAQPRAVTLARGVEIRGRVVRGEEPVAGVAVFARPTAEGGDMMALFSQRADAAEAVSDAEGRFVLEGLAAGPHTVSAAEAPPLDFEEVEVEAPASDVTLVLRPTATLAGSVVDGRNGEPIAAFSVRLAPVRDADEDGAMPFEMADAYAREEEFGGGAFSLDEVPEGQYRLVVVAEGFLPLTVDDVTVAAHEDAEPLALRLDAGATLRGRVLDEEGQPLADVRVAVEARDGASGETDAAGDYELHGVATGAFQVQFRKSGFRSERAKVQVPPEGARQDARLRRGLSLAGVVVDEGGRPVADARVGATTAAAGGENAGAEADAEGRFRLEGLAPGRYVVWARGADGQAKQEDVDPEKSPVLRLVIEKPRTAVLRGRVSGMPAGEAAMRVVYVQAEDGRSGDGVIGADGTFRVERAPAGRVRVSAMVATMEGNMRTSRSRQLTLAAGAEAEVELEFAADVVVGGHVVRDGEPVVGAFVSFQPVGGAEGQTARTDGSGAYEAVGLETGLHQVSVSARELSYETEYVVAGSATLDLDVTGAAIAGRVIAADDQRPLADVTISLWKLDGRDNTPADTLRTGADGAFFKRGVREGRYRLVTSLAGFGQEVREVELVRGQPADALEIALMPAQGLKVAVVDARDQRPLDALIVVRDAARRIVANAHSGVDQDGFLTIGLAPGRYLLSTSATGYGTATLPVTAPGEGLRVGLTPGGTLELESAQPMSGRVRLIQPDGEEYVRCWCNGIAEIRLHGTRTRIENVTPGSYRIELVGESGEVRAGPTVVVVEGAVATAVLE